MATFYHNRPIVFHYLINSLVINLSADGVCISFLEQSVWETGLEWIDIANTEYRYTAIRIPVNTGIPVFLTCFFKPNWTADRREKSSFNKILMWRFSLLRKC
jgi:hypothetical protein